MANNPNLIDCPADAWIKVGEGMMRGGVSVLSSKAIYLWTYRTAGAKLNADQMEGARVDGNRLEIDAVSPIDVYIKAIRDIGLVRVDDWS